MDKIEVPSEAVAQLGTINAGLTGVRIVMVNVFALSSPSAWILVDAGLRGSSPWIVRWAKRLVSASAPSAIVLTHGHFDHVGALPDLLGIWDVPVYVHREELPYVTGMRSYPSPDPLVGGGVMARIAKLYPSAPIDLGSRAHPLPDDGSVPLLEDWRWIHTPGHTAGHVSLFRDGDRTLVAGDAFCTTKQESLLAVATQAPELHGPPAYFTTDWNAARDSVRRLADLRPGTIAPGHGRPVRGRAITAALSELANRFDEVAKPQDGRYVRHPVPG